MLRRVALAFMNHTSSSLASRVRSSGRLAAAARPLINRVVGPELVAIVVRSGPAKGLRLQIDPQSEKFYWTGQHERWVQDAIAASLQPGMVFWDVGAHIGFMSLLASRIVGPAGSVRAVEPSDANRARLEANVELNGARNVTVEDCALGAERGTAMLYAHRSSAMWTLVRDRGEGDGENVLCRTLDDLLGAGPPPDVIKVDVEGAEVDVLRGGATLVVQHHPTLLVEFSNEGLLQEARELLPEYDFRLLGKNHWLLT